MSDSPSRWLLKTAREHAAPPSLAFVLPRRGRPQTICFTSAMHDRANARQRSWTILPAALALLACAAAPAAAATGGTAVPVVPVPAEAHAAPGSFTLTTASRIVVHGGGAEGRAVAEAVA